MSSSCEIKEAKIYKLVATGTTKCYIGSTTGTLQRRLWHHNHASKNDKQTQCASKQLYDHEPVSIQLIETVQYDQMIIREKYWIENTECVNKNIPGQTWKDRAIKNAESIKATREARKNNPEKREHDRQKEKERKSLPEVKERNIELNKLWKEKNAEKIKANKQLIIICANCGDPTSKGNKWRHDKVCKNNIA